MLWLLHDLFDKVYHGPLLGMAKALGVVTAATRHHPLSPLDAPRPIPVLHLPVLK